MAVQLQRRRIEAATAVQAGARGRAARGGARERRQLRAAVALQAAVRGNSARGIAERKRYELPSPATAAAAEVPADLCSTADLDATRRILQL